MKKLLFIIPALLFSLLGFSQGIIFENGTWVEMFGKAQQSNKPVFVNFYTSGCDSCKQMAKDVFPLESVGKVYNENFICWQIDAEKGEGVSLAKRCRVTTFPTYLFIGTDGNILCRALGSMDAQSFIGVSDIVLNKVVDAKSMDAWESEYAGKKDDPAFLKGYIRKRFNAGLSNAFLFDNYLKLIPEEERTSSTVVNLYAREGQFLRVNSLAFENLQKNSSKFNELLGSVNLLIFTGIKNTVDDAADSKDEKLLATAMAVYDQLPQKGLPMLKDELLMNYYKKTGETDKYLKHLDSFCEESLMKISNDTIEERNKANIQMVEKMIKSGTLPIKDSTLIAKLIDQSSHSESERISNKLNGLSREVFEQISDKKALKNALNWSKRSMELSPDNVQLLDTYANLLYKLGKKKEAIDREEKALSRVPKEQVSQYNRIEETLTKMKAGEKTWKN